MPLTALALLSISACAPPEVHASGTFDVRGTWDGDLDEGAETSDGADFNWRQDTETERGLLPTAEAQFAVMGTSPLEWGDCAGAPVTSDRISADDPDYSDMPSGTWICARTSEARVSAFEVVAIGDSPERTLTLAFTTWE